MEYAPGLSVNWTEREAAKIAEIKARRKDGATVSFRRRGQSEELQHLRDLWHYWDYFFAPEVAERVTEEMKWRARYGL